MKKVFVCRRGVRGSAARSGERRRRDRCRVVVRRVQARHRAAGSQRRRRHRLRQRAHRPAGAAGFVGARGGEQHRGTARVRDVGDGHPDGPAKAGHYVRRLRWRDDLCRSEIARRCRTDCSFSWRRRAESGRRRRDLVHRGRQAGGGGPGRRRGRAERRGADVRRPPAFRLGSEGPGDRQDRGRRESVSDRQRADAIVGRGACRVRPRRRPARRRRTRGRVAADGERRRRHQGTSGVESVQGHQRARRPPRDVLRQHPLGADPYARARHGRGLGRPAARGRRPIQPPPHRSRRRGARAAARRKTSISRASTPTTARSPTRTTT